MEKNDIGNPGGEFICVKMPRSTLLMVNCRRGALACGYLNLAIAEKMGEAMAMVTGVKTLEDMLNAEVCALSSAAAALGIQKGMKGEDAINILSSSDLA